MFRFSMLRCRRATAGIAAAALVAGLATPSTASAATPVSSSSASSAAAPLTSIQALHQARSSGKPVAVPSATTDVSTLTANPNGTMSLDLSPIPVRKRVGGAWQDLDATLVKNADGTISPKSSTTPLTLSGGGTGPLASLTAAGDALAISLPTDLPAPTLSGDTATYANIAPGVDLVVTADTLGGFSDTFVVRDAAAAASPQLAGLLHATVKGRGVSVTAQHGALAATDRSGRAVFAGNTPVLWDSSTAAATQSAAIAGTPASGAAASSVRAPGAHAHVGALTPTVTGDSLSLAPDTAVLHGSSTAYPVYIDPTWNPTLSTNTGWATVAQQYPTQTYWNTTAQGGGYMAVGDGVSDFPLLARSLINFPLPSSTLAGSTIQSAVFSATNEYSGACPDGASDEQLNVDAPSSTLTSSNADWNSWNSASEVGPQIGYKSFAYGYSSSCSTGASPSSVSISLLTSTFSNDVAAGKQTQTLALVAANESSEYSWKEFIASTAKLTLTYDMTPAITRTAAGSVGCGTASNPGVLGKGSVQLVAGVYQKGGSSLTADFRVYNSAKTTEYNPSSATGATTSSPSAVAATSGTNASLTLSSGFFGGFSTTSPTTFAWTVSDTDGTLSSPTTTCYFTYDPTSPGAPTLYDATGTDCDSSTQTYTVGTPASFTVDHNAGGTTPSTYYYQLNGAAPVAVPTTGDAAFSLKPTSGSNVLTVDAAGTAGNIGNAATCYFNAKAPASATDHDMTGDATPDLVTTGTGTGASPAGLWLAAGTKSGPVNSVPTDIGVNGAGLAGAAGDYTGAQAVIGQFTGNGFNDVLAYYPAGTTLNGTAQPLTAAQGEIITGTGDGSSLQSEYSQNVTTAQYATLTDNNGLYPAQIANAYHADTSNTSTAYPDLIGTAGNASTGYYLDYYPATTSIGGYYTQSLSNALTVSANTPDGTADWNDWTIATTQIGTSVDMYVWNESAGMLYLWTGVTVTDNGDNTGTLAYAASYPLYDGSTGHTFDKGVAMHQLEAADINGDGTPDLWAVDATGKATAYLVTNLSTTANATTVAAGGAETLSMATHDWPLNDLGSGTTAHDDATTGALTLTGSGNVASHTGDLFSPDAAFAGGSEQLAATASAVDLTHSFSLSLWTKPMTYGTMPISQDGTAYPGLMLYPTQSGWEFYLAKDNGAASWNGDNIVGGSVQLGTWAHLEATYNSMNGVMSLYVDDTFVATGTHTAPTSGATGDLRLGSDIDNGTQTSYYTGQVAEVQTYSGLPLAPNQTPSAASYHQSIVPERILDTRQSATNTYSGVVENGTALAANGTLALPVVNDTVTPTASGAPTTIPSTATAVALDVTVTGETSNGNLTAYADGSQRPLTSSTNYVANTIVTGYQIVPVGLDGKVALYNASSGTTQVLVDITGYFTSDATLAGDQTYHPLATAYRAVNTGASTANTNLAAAGTAPGNKPFTMNVTGVDGIPSTATGVAVDLTTTYETGGGYLEVYPTGSTVAADTALTFQTNYLTSMSADVPLGTGGTITIVPMGSSTRVYADISGYYTSDTTGQVYHAVNPTRLVDTRSGIGGGAAAVAGGTTYAFGEADTNQITTAPTPTLALMITATQATNGNALVAYPENATQPGTLSLTWITGQTIANLALTPTSSAGGVDLHDLDAGGTVQLVVDCSGYFAAN